MSIDTSEIINFIDEKLGLEKINEIYLIGSRADSSKQVTEESDIDVVLVGSSDLEDIARNTFEDPWSEIPISINGEDHYIDLWYKTNSNTVEKPRKQIY